MNYRLWKMNKDRTWTFIDDFSEIDDAIVRAKAHPSLWCSIDELENSGRNAPVAIVYGKTVYKATETNSPTESEDSE